MGLFFGGGSAQLIAQTIGIAAAFLWAFPVSLALFFLIKAAIGLRVSAAEELEGLDISEHGILAYPPVLVAESFTGPAVSGASYSVSSPIPAPVVATISADNS